ncbi:MAG: hypothetical protein ACO36B_06950, partial [Methylophilaceae bacterium]
MNNLEVANLVKDMFVDVEPDSLTEQLYISGNQPWHSIAKMNQTRRGLFMEDFCSNLLYKHNIKHTRQVNKNKTCNCCKSWQRYIVDFEFENGITVELKSSLYTCGYGSKKLRKNSRTQFPNPELVFQNIKVCSETPYSYIWLVALPPNKFEINSWLIPYEDWCRFATDQETKSNNFLKYKGLSVVNKNGNTVSGLIWRGDTPDWLVSYEGIEDNLNDLQAISGQNGHIGQG